MTQLAAIVHRIDPFAVQFTETFGIRWYGLSYAIGFLLAYLIMRQLAKRRIALIRPEHTGDLIVYLAIGTIVGGRLGYYLFYKTEALFSAEILQVWQGGMASHGGMIGMILACILYGRRRGVPVWHLIDLVALTATIGVIFGRIANFINGELVGRVAPADLPWAVKFPQKMTDWSGDQLHTLEPLVAKLGIGITPGDWHRMVEEDSPMVRRVVDRLIELTQQHGPQADAITAQLADLLQPRHPSQLYAAMSEGVFVAGVLWIIFAYARKPGVVAGWAIVLYAMGRFFNEFFRMPDAHIANMEFAATGLSRGQWLSIVMFAAGVVVLIFNMRRKTDRIGGWYQGPRRKDDDDAAQDAPPPANRA